MSSFTITQKINEWAKKEKDKKESDLYNLEQLQTDHKVIINELTLASIKSRIYQARIFMFVTNIAFLLLIYIIVFKGIFYLIEFKFIYFIVILLTYIFINLIIKAIRKN